MGIRILIANDHQIFRQGLRALLEKEPDMEVVGEAGDGLKTVALVREHTPHVVIINVNLPNLNGIEATRQILADYPATKIIVFSVHVDRFSILNMLKAGACGYLLKHCPFEELAQAICLVMANKIYLAPGVTDVVVMTCPHTSYGIAPKSKWPIRFSRIGHLLLRQDMVSRNHLAGLPCPILSVLPRIISGENWKNNRQGTEIVFNITQNSCFVKAPG